MAARACRKEDADKHKNLHKKNAHMIKQYQDAKWF